MMFSNTLREVDNCLNCIQCHLCHQPSDQLQFLGNSCKHVFCWKCIDDMCKSDAFRLCSSCSLPLDFLHPIPATFINQFYQNLIIFKEHLSSIQPGDFDHNTLANLMEPDQKRRTIEEFCATQQQDVVAVADAMEVDKLAVETRKNEPISLVNDEFAKENIVIEEGVRYNDEFVNHLINKYTDVDMVRDVVPHHLSSEESRATSERIGDESKEVSDSASDERSVIEPAPNDLSHLNEPAISQILQKSTASKNSKSDGTVHDDASVVHSLLSDRTGNESNGRENKPKINFLAEETQECEAVNPSPMMTQEIPVFKEPDEYLFFKSRPSATFHNGAVNLHRMEELHQKIISQSTSNRQCSVSKRERKLHRKKMTNDLMKAALSGQKQPMLSAIAMGEDVNQRDAQEYTALHHVVALNAVDLCQILVENGAVINAYGGELCETPLHIGVRNDAFDAVKYLLSKGAVKKAKNIKGERPIDLLRNESMKRIFHQINQCMQIVYPSCMNRRYSVYLSNAIPQRLASEGRKYLQRTDQYTDRIENATHYVVKTAFCKYAEASGRIMEAILRGLFIVSDEWLQRCIESGKLIDESGYEVDGFVRERQLLGEHSNAKARKNRLNMKPGLFRGCHFYICQHDFQYTVRKDVLIRLIKLGEGVLLTREPKACDYVESGIRPFHAPSSWNDQPQMTGVFAIYVPGQAIPRRIIEQKLINIVTPLWLQECVLRFELLPPDAH